jgi:hypothetical protein
MTQMTRAAAALAVALILGLAADVAAQAPARPSQATPAPAARRFDPITAPTGQEMIRALIALQTTPLAHLTRCAGKGANESDVDVGDFLAGYAATFVEQGHNWVVTLARPAPPANGVRVWRALVSFHRSHGDEDWAWGMEFLMRADDHSLVPSSISCVGMG